MWISKFRCNEKFEVAVVLDVRVSKSYQRSSALYIKLNMRFKLKCPDINKMIIFS